MEMTPERWEEIGSLYERALSVPAEQRTTLLDYACAGDPALRREVETLLAVYEADPDFLETPAPDLASDVQALEMSLALEKDEHVGPYRLVRPLGEGGMGQVFLAVRDLGAARQMVALKLLRPGLDDADFLRRFADEQQILAQLDHPNVARLLDAGRTEAGRPFLVMEYVDGESITAYCDRHSLSVEERLRLFMQACEAVQFAHRHLVIHRDLKPSNILVTRPHSSKPENGQVKLLDFGIAKMVQPWDVGAARTRTSQRLLTPAYASPEQVNGGPVATLSDVYTLGVLLYELLTGRRPFPFEGKTEVEIARILAEEDPAAPSSVVTEALAAGKGEAGGQPRSPDRLRRRLRGDLDTIALMALRKEPHRRYDSPQALAEDLRRHLDGLPVRAQPDTAGYRVRKFARRHWGAVAAAAFFVLLLSGFAAAMTVQQTATARERDRAEQELARSETVTAFLMDLFAANRPSEARGDTLTARALLERGLARVEELDEQPAVQTQMLDLVGQIYRSLGEYDKASPLLEKALAERRRLPEAAQADLATTLSHLAGLRTDQARFEEATLFAEEALAVCRASRGETHPCVAANLDQLATLLKHQGRYDEAEARFRELIVLERRLHADDHERLTSTFHNLGRLLDAKADYAGSAEAFREAHASALRAYGEDHPNIAVVLNSLGLALHRAEQYEEAEALLRDVVALRRRLLGPAHPGLATSLNTLAIVLAAKGDTDGALALLEEALTIYRAAYGKAHPEVATTLYNMGRFLHQAGRLEAAEARYREALALRRETLGDDHPRTALASAQVGRLLFEQGRYADAEALLLEALGTYRTKLGDDHAWVAETRQDLVQLYEAWGRPTRADAYRTLPAPAAAEGA